MKRNRADAPAGPSGIEDSTASPADSDAAGPTVIPVGVGQQPPESAQDSEVDGAIFAEWIAERKFSTIRLQPGYDMEEVDTFLDAIRDTFLGIMEPSVTPDEIRDKQFSTTRLRPGYVAEEVDAFLEAAELRLGAQADARADAAWQRPAVGDPTAEALQIRCLECGAENADAAEACARCGAPASYQPSTADPAIAQWAGRSGPSRHLLITVGVAAALLALAGLIAGWDHSRSSSGTASSPPQPVPSTFQAESGGLQPGDCLTGSDLGLGTGSTWPDLVTVVPCTQPHTAEVFFSDDAWPQSMAYPGDNSISYAADNRCETAFDAYDGVSTSTESIFTYDDIIPDSDSWPDGDRLLVCVAYKDPDAAPVNYSIKGSHQ